MEDKEYIEMNIADAIMERPHGFSVGRRQFYLYPVTLGKTYLLSSLMKELDAKEEVIRYNPYMETLRLCAAKKEIVCRIISYHTINKKEQLFDNGLILRRCKFLSKNLSNEEMAQLLIIVLTSDNTDMYIKHLGIDEEKELLSKASKVKKNNGSLSFGGKSIYGTLIDSACERYGWTMEYVVWGISYTNLRLLMSDAVTTIYLNEEERKKLHISTDREIIRADDPKNMERIMSMNWD